MHDGWFPRFSPSGARLMRGSVTLTVDSVVWSGGGGGISGAWLSDDVLLYRQHDTGALRRVAAGLDEVIGPPCAWVAARAGRYACWALRDGVPVVWTGDGRQWPGYGGGWGPIDLAPDGTLVLGHHATGALELVAPGARVPVRIADEGRTPRCGAAGVVWVSGSGRLGYADLRTHAVRDVTVPGESCHGPVLVDTPDGEWLLTHTASDRLVLLPLGGTEGYIVAEGDTRYPDAVWTPQGVRVAWSDGHGTPGEALVSLDAPRVDLTARPVWHVVGTEVDTLPFLVPSYAGTLCCPADGQTLQTVRTGVKEVTCLKGAPERQERWRWDDTAVYLTYDASDGRDQPWRVTPEPVWCPRVSFVGDSQVYGGTRLVRRTATGGSEAHPFPLRTSVYAYGEHIPIAGIGRCRILSTTWEPGYPVSEYQERHWWAIRESDGLRFGRVRYEEWRDGALSRAFDFLPSDAPALTPAAPLAIPDPVETPDPPDPPDRPDTPDMPEPTIRDDEFANAGGRIEHRYATWQRPGREVHTDPLSYRWMVDYYVLRRAGRDHEAAVREVERRMDVAAGVAAPEPEPVPPVTPPAGAARPLRALGRVLVTADDQRPADWREASAFMLLARYLKGEDIEPTLDWWAARGATALRVFASIGHPAFWEPRGWLLTPKTMGLYAGMRRVTEMAAARGLWLRWTLIADMPYTMPTQREQERHVAHCAEVLSGLPVIVELANEPTMNGYRDDWPSVLAGLAGLAVSYDLPVLALGAEHGSSGHLPTADRPPATLVTFHAERRTSESGWAWVRRLSEYGVVLDGKRPVLSGEPINAGDQGAPGDFQPDPAIWFAYGALSRVVPSHGYAPCFHFDDGLWALVPTGATLACWQAFVAGCDAVPMDARFGPWVNGHWAESPWRGYDQTDPPSDDRPSRIFGRLVDGRYWGVSIREPKGWAWRDLRYPIERVARAEGERFDCSVWRAA